MSDDGPWETADGAFRRLVWELVDDDVGCQGDRLVLSRASDGLPALWLELHDDRLQLSDGNAAQVLPNNSTSRHVRALVSEWHACDRTLAIPVAHPPHS